LGWLLLDNSIGQHRHIRAFLPGHIHSLPFPGHLTPNEKPNRNNDKGVFLLPDLHNVPRHMIHSHSLWRNGKSYWEHQLTEG